MDATSLHLNWTCTARAEASELGINPGEWPEYIALMGPGGTPITVFRLQLPEEGAEGVPKPAVYSYGAKHRVFELTVYGD